MKCDIFPKKLVHRLEYFLPYRLLVTQTLHELVEAERGLHNAEYPLTAKLTDGLDGSGSHTIYNQKQIHPDLTTKNFLLFSFKILWIKDLFGNIFMEKSLTKFPLRYETCSFIGIRRKRRKR